MGVRGKNGSFSGMLGELAERSKEVDTAILFSRHDILENEFIPSPTIRCEHAIFYYFLRLDTKLANILWSLNSIRWDIYLLFGLLFVLTFLFHLIKSPRKLSSFGKLRLLFDLLFKGLQLMLQSSVRCILRQSKQAKFVLLLKICITFFFLSFFIASLNTSYIELDKSNMLETAEGLYYSDNYNP